MHCDNCRSLATCLKQSEQGYMELHRENHRLEMKLLRLTWLDVIKLFFGIIPK